MPKVKKPHHKGSYDSRSRKLVAQAKANPQTRCWRCGLTLAQVQALYPRRRVHWTAGHINPGEVNGELRPECSVDNYRHGAAYGNRRRKTQRMATSNPLNTSRTW